MPAGPCPSAGALAILAPRTSILYFAGKHKLWTEKESPIDPSDAASCGDVRVVKHGEESLVVFHVV